MGPFRATTTGELQMTEDFEQMVREIADRYPSENAREAVRACEAGELSWAFVYESFRRLVVPEVRMGAWSNDA